MREHVRAAAVVRNECRNDAESSARFSDSDVTGEELANHQEQEGHRQHEEKRDKTSVRAKSRDPVSQK